MLKNGVMKEDQLVQRLMMLNEQGKGMSSCSWMNAMWCEA